MPSSAEQETGETAELPAQRELPLPEGVRPEVRDELRRLLALAESLRELPLDCVQPAFAPPRWG